MEHIKPQGEHFVPHGHEESDVNVKAILGFGIGLAVSGLVLVLVLGFFYKGLGRWYERRQGQPNPMTQASAEAAKQFNPMAGGPESQQETVDRIRQTFPEPRLQPNEYVDYEVYSKTLEEQMSGYTWIDKNKGEVRIPVERAIEILAERGLPNVPAGNVTAAAQQAAQSAPGRKAPNLKQ